MGGGTKVELSSDRNERQTEIKIFAREKTNNIRTAAQSSSSSSYTGKIKSVLLPSSSPLPVRLSLSFGNTSATSYTFSVFIGSFFFFLPSPLLRTRPLRNSSATNPTGANNRRGFFLFVGHYFSPFIFARGLYRYDHIPCMKNVFPLRTRFFVVDIGYAYKNNNRPQKRIQLDIPWPPLRFLWSRSIF